MSRTSSRQAPCDLCEHSRFEQVASRDRRGQELATVVCRTCGLISHERIPSDDELSSYYQQQYRADYHGEYSPSAYRVVREWNRGRELLRLLAPFLQPEATVFEVGSGMGCTVKNFECAGYNALGIEPGDGFRAFATNQLGARIFPGVLAQLAPEPLGDMALLVHVLEHFNSPTRALQHIRTLLRAGGRLYVEVPNAAAPHAAPGKMFHFAHIYNFTPATLQMLAQKARFRVHTWLSQPRDRNIRVLLERCHSETWQIDPTSFDQTMQSLQRYGKLGYHLRWEYLTMRLRTIVSHRMDHVRARARMEHIVGNCRQHTRPNTNLPQAA